MLTGFTQEYVVKLFSVRGQCDVLCQYEAQGSLQVRVAVVLLMYQLSACGKAFYCCLSAHSTKSYMRIA